MNLLDKYSFSDGNIKEIVFREDDVIVNFIQWNDIEIVFEFKNCWKLINCKSIGTEIEDVIIIKESSIIDDIRNEIIETGGSKEEADKLYQISFKSSWDNKDVLIIIAGDLKIS
ncbi:hypothetical protein [Abyssisolibacter fermentans]|uniref:hypothetical protein n=1 Tax=Abyssisolibacter fermentans TaxID=1766203 RepID=UPI000836DB95|nr:hypothetical protein [Abyssisolibacter fermentans]